MAITRTIQSGTVDRLGLGTNRRAALSRAAARRAAYTLAGPLLGTGGTQRRDRHGWTRPPTTVRLKTPAVEGSIVESFGLAGPPTQPLGGAGHLIQP